MIKVMCAKAELIPAQVPADERVFSYFKGAKRAGIGTIANRWHGALKRGGFRPLATKSIPPIRLSSPPDNKDMQSLVRKAPSP